MARPGERVKKRHVPRGEKTPERTCTGCRKAAHPRELVRMVTLPDGRVALDPKTSSGGRGAWVHPTRGCVEAMVKRHAAERSLKVEVQRDLDAGALLASLREAIARKAASLLVVASRVRGITIGVEASAEALERGRVHLVVVARDAGQTASGLVADGTEGGPRVLRYSTKTELGGVFGRGEVALLALTDPRIAAELAVTIERLAALED